MEQLDETAFVLLANTELAALEAAIERAADDAGVDCDTEIAQGGILNVEFETGDKVVINAHVAMREIWLASRLGAHHFRYQDGVWRDTREGAALRAVLNRALPTLAGGALSLAEAD